MPTPYRTPKRVNGDLPQGNAVGVGQFPPKTPRRGDPVTAGQLRDISEAAARPNQLQRTMPGLNFGAFTGNPEFKMPNLFFEGILLEDMRASTDPFDDPVVVQMKVIKPLNHKENVDQEALSFADIGDEVYIVNRATDISGSSGGRVFCISVSGELRPMGGGGGSSSCTRVRFQVIVSDSLTRTALCAIVSRPYGCGINDIPSTVIDGAAVEICDPAGCFFNDPNDLLQGREGWAEYMMPESGTTFCQDGSYYLVPEWQVYSLCCATDTCNL